MRNETIKPGRMRHPATSARRRIPAVSALLALTLVAGTAGGTGATAYAGSAGTKPAACAPPTSPTPSAASPTTITTIEQAYYCIIGNYYSGSVLDDRVLLTGAFAALAQELETLGLDRADAVLPALSGDHDGDWAAFSAVYQRVVGELPARAALRQELAAATMDGIRGTVAAAAGAGQRWRF